VTHSEKETAETKITGFILTTNAMIQNLQH
jgi:hypothetical protein